MTKKEALKEFNELFPKNLYTTNGYYDRVARSEDWCNYTDMLQKTGRITEKQDYTWVNPF